MSPLPCKYPIRISALPLGLSDTTLDCCDVALTSQPRDLPAAPRLSLHHFCHYHPTEVCRALHIHRQRTHYGPILQRRQLHESYVVCPESTRRWHSHVSFLTPEVAHSHCLNCPSWPSFAQKIFRLLPTALPPWAPGLFTIRLHGSHGSVSDCVQQPRYLPHP